VHEEQGKIGLALSGGIGKGFFHVGALSELVKQKIPFSYVAAVSAGALAAAKLLEVLPDADASEAFALTHLSRLPFRKRKNILKSVYQLEDLGQLVGTWDMKKIMESEIRLDVIAADLTNGQERVFTNRGDSGEVFLKGILGSCALPPLFEPSHVEGRDYIDGGMIKPLPVSNAVEAGCETIIVIDGDPRNPELSFGSYEKRKMLKMGYLVARASGFSLYQLARKELEEADRLKKKLVIIRPQEPLLEDGTKWNAEDAVRMIAEGKRIAEYALRNALLII
jgi:predicted acylesterase/phospholipase RssA